MRNKLNPTHAYRMRNAYVKSNTSRVAHNMKALEFCPVQCQLEKEAYSAKQPSEYLLGVIGSQSLARAIQYKEAYSAIQEGPQSYKKRPIPLQ